MAEGSHMESESVALTPQAAAKLLEIRTEAAPLLRLYVAGQGCCSVRYGLAFVEAAAPDDRVSELHGVPVVLSEESREACEGATIDWVETPAGSGFTVRGPAREGAGCGCGRNLAN